MYTKPKLEKYRNSEFIQFLKDIVKTYKGFNLTTLNLQPLIVELEPLITQLSDVFELDKKNPNTLLLEKADLRRDQALLGIKTLAAAYENYYEANFTSAAAVITAIFEKYGAGIANYNYRDETNVINSILNNFDTDAAASEAITFLNINNWKEELKNANNEFNDIYIVRNRDISAQPDQNLRDLRKPIIEKYRALVEKTSSYYNITGTTDYKTILDELENIIIKFNSDVPKPQPKPKPPVV